MRLTVIHRAGVDDYLAPAMKLRVNPRETLSLRVFSNTDPLENPWNECILDVVRESDALLTDQSTHHSSIGRSAMIAAYQADIQSFSYSYRGNIVIANARAKQLAQVTQQ